MIAHLPAKTPMTTPPICDYEGSDYQASFWGTGERAYEDGAEAVALRRLLPRAGKLMLELGAGAGRNTARYAGFERIVLLDYSSTQLEQAQQRLGLSDRYVYVAADVYRLPFVSSLFGAATMIRTLHHMADAPAALRQVRRVLRPGAAFILEYANKLNLKAILRYALGRQSWSPFTPEPVEFEKLNYDFHPRAVRSWLTGAGFGVEKTLTVSHFRAEALKRIVPTGILVFLDSTLQWTGGMFQLTPSVFVRARVPEKSDGAAADLEHIPSYFMCPNCATSPLTEGGDHLACPRCGRRYALRGGIYDFRESM